MAAALAVCLVVFCVSAYMVISRLVEEKRNAESFAALAAQIRLEEPTCSAAVSTTQPETLPTGADIYRVTTDTAGVFSDSEPQPDPGFHKYDDLYSRNSDLFGWICIEGTRINYPVMHTPDDPEYYLSRDFDGNKSTGGVPFLDGSCYEGCGNYIVYGHNMKNGAMFAEITDYADEEFWKEHPVICFDTVDEMGEYEVLAAFYAKVCKKDDDNAFRYYDYTDLTDEAVFDEYLECVYDADLYDTGVAARYGDQLLTLTTCSNRGADGRFVVVARKKEA